MQAIALLGFVRSLQPNLAQDYQNTLIKNVLAEHRESSISGLIFLMTVILFFFFFLLCGNFAFQDAMCYIPFLDAVSTMGSSPEILTEQHAKISLLASIISYLKNYDTDKKVVKVLLYLRLILSSILGLQKTIFNTTRKSPSTIT